MAILSRLLQSVRQESTTPRVGHIYWAEPKGHVSAEDIQKMNARMTKVGWPVQFETDEPIRRRGSPRGYWIVGPDNMPPDLRDKIIRYLLVDFYIESISGHSVR